MLQHTCHLALYSSQDAPHTCAEEPTSSAVDTFMSQKHSGSPFGLLEMLLALVQAAQDFRSGKTGVVRAPLGC